jgi:hypothetical protein
MENSSIKKEAKEEKLTGKIAILHIGITNQG